MGTPAMHQTAGWPGMLCKVSPAFQCSLIGLLFISIFTSRLAFGIATLPLGLSGSGTLPLEDPGSWRRLQILIWFLVAIAYLPSWLLSFVLFGVPYVLTSHLPFYALSDWFGRLAPVAEVGAIFGVALWIMGAEGRCTARSAIRLLGLRWTFFALAIPVCIELLISSGQYLVARVQWAAHDFGKVDTPMLGSFFDVPSAWLLLLFFGAFCEEVIFRGVLQARFIQRYGLYRGIFLVGIIWAVFHFYSDFSFRHFTASAVLLTVGFRMFMTVTLSFILGWLTLRSGSVLPATVAHAVYNILVFSGFGVPFVGKATVRVALWALLACVSFRYWGPPAKVRIESLPAESQN
jgi:membrane protease YdiL (CAAX protease family)